jgi:hypothetical protein
MAFRNMIVNDPDQPWTARERINNWAMLGENSHHSDDGNTISFNYTPAAGSGTLTVSSGGRVVASIDMIGTYTSANFSITSGVSGTVAIVDPTVVNGGSAELGPAQAFPRHGLDLPDIAFGAQTTIAYSENRTNAGGTLTVTDGRHAASVALLGNYHGWKLRHHGGGTLLTQATQTGQRPLLTHPVP